MRKKVKHKNEAVEVLAAGILQLPGYLESLYHGNPDLPLVLLPMLNDFRASQDSELLTEGDFFSPDLTVKVPVQPIGKSTVAGNVATVAKKLRPGYLSGLLGVFRDNNLEKSHEKLTLVLDNLLIASSSEKEEQLWWVALGAGADSTDFLGTQGYIWDTQSDMALALLGAILGLALLSRWQDRQLGSIASG